MVATDPLWGGQLTGVQFDPVRHQCDLAVTTTVSGQSSHFVVCCRDVSDLRFHNTIPEPWTYAEITEAHLSADEATGQELLDVMLWSEDAGFSIRCGSVDIRVVDR